MSDANAELRVEVRHDGTRTVVIPTGEIDLATVDPLKDALDRCRGDVIVDLADVPFIDSSGFRVLVAHRTRLQPTGGSLTVQNPSATVRRAFKAIGLDDLVA